jgi:hypothetical protein
MRRKEAIVGIQTTFSLSHPRIPLAFRTRTRHNTSQRWIYPRADSITQGTNPILLMEKFNNRLLTIVAAAT